MRSKLVILALARLPLAGCSYTPTTCPIAASPSVNVPVVTSADYVFDAAAPGGALAPGEADRLNGWFQGLGLGYGDTIYVDGAYADRARAQVAAVAGRYGMLVTRRRPGHRRAWSSPARSAWSSAAAAPKFRTARTGAVPSQPDFDNRSMSNFGCAVNSNLAAMVANPEDLIHGREGSGVDRHVDRDQGRRVLPHDAADRHQGSAGRQHQEGRQVMNAPFQARAGSARSVHRLRLRRCDRRHAAAGGGRARLVAGEGQQGRPAQRGPVAVGLGEPEHPVRRPSANPPTR